MNASSLPSTRPAWAQILVRVFPDGRRILGFVLAVVLLRLLLGWAVLPVSAAFPDTPLERQVSVAFGDAPLGQWLQRVVVMPWVRYDAYYYANIAESGYRAPGTAAFHPLYGLIAAPLAWLLGGNIFAALILISTAATIVLCVAFARYVERVHGDQLAAPAAVLLLVAPPAFIMLAPYNEGLFLALAVGVFLAIEDERWWLAGVLGGLAALTRQQGVALALPLAWALLQGLRSGRVRWWQLSAAGLVPLGYALVVVYRALTLGDLASIMQARGPFDLLHRVLVSSSAEQVVVGQRIAWPWESIIAQIQIIPNDPASYQLIIDLGLGLAGVLMVLLGWHSMTAGERWYTGAITLLTLCYFNGTLRPCLSMPRHMLLAFPLFIVLARWTAGSPLRRVLVGAILLLGNVILALGFVRHGWIP